MLAYRGRPRGRARRRGPPARRRPWRRQRSWPADSGSLRCSGRSTPRTIRCAGIDVDVDQAREEADLDAGRGHQLVEHELIALDAEGGPAVEPLAVEIGRDVRGQEPAAVHGGDDFAHQAADEHALAVGHGIEGGDQSRGAHAAQAAGGFQEQDLGPQPGRAHRCGRARRAAAGDDQIVARLDRNIPGQPIGLLARPAWLPAFRPRRPAVKPSRAAAPTDARCADSRGFQERSSIDLQHGTTSLFWTR